IAHVLFTDIVGYSKLPINEQRALVERLNEIVRSTDEFQAAETAGRLIKIPTGDGITLVFYQSPEAPVECALEISRALKKHPELPEKLKAARVAAAAKRKRVALRRWSLGVLAVLTAVAAIGFLFFHYKRPPSAVESPIPQKSVAVLPFENLSEEKSNAYFADGVQDEILTDLAKIADLKVISRVSVMQYKSGVPRNVRQ